MVTDVSNKLTAIVEACKEMHDASLYLFGSGVRTTDYSNKSDLDFLFNFQADENGNLLPPYFDYFDFLFHLENITGKKVDVVAEKKIKNKYFLETIEKERVKIYEYHSKKYLEDILLSIDTIKFHVKNITSLSEYDNNITIRDTVERRLAMIGGAMNQINKRDKLMSITNKPKIISLRHVLIHEYDLIEDATIWNIVFNHLPVLKNEAQILLNSSN